MRLLHRHALMCLGTCWVSPRRGFLTNSFHGKRNPLRFPINAGDRNGPARHQIDSGYEFGKKGRQKLPVPAEKVNQHGCNAEIQYVIRRRYGTLDEEGEDDKLQCIGKDGQHYGCSNARTRRDFNGVVRHVSLLLSVCSFPPILRRERWRTLAAWRPSNCSQPCWESIQSAVRQLLRHRSAIGTALPLIEFHSDRLGKNLWKQQSRCRGRNGHAKACSSAINTARQHVCSTSGFG